MKEDDQSLLINDDDGCIIRMVHDMRAAFKSDQAQLRKEPAVNKLKLLPQVKKMLINPKLREALVDNQMMHVVAEWLSLLPDKNLPPLDIRSDFLRILHDYYLGLDTEALKSSGLGQAVKFILHHPKETAVNKKLAKTLITEWARGIFNISTDYKTVSRDERKWADFERASKSQHTIAEDNSDHEESIVRSRKRPMQAKNDERKVPRARVPRISTTDYVVRPEPNVDQIFKGESKYTGQVVIKKAQRQFAERTRGDTFERAVKVSVHGKKL